MNGLQVHILHLLIYFLFAYPSLAMVPQGDLDFIYYTKNEGLSNMDITCIVQDHEGYIWAGTKDGLNRFDGHSFKTYKAVKDAGKYSICGNHITDLLVGKNGDIWISTLYSGISQYNPKTGIFKHFNYSQNNFYSLSNNSVLGLAEDANGDIWAATYFLQNKIDYETHEVKRYFNHATLKYTPIIKTELQETGIHDSIINIFQTNKGYEFSSINELENMFIKQLGIKTYTKIKGKLFPWGSVLYDVESNKERVASSITANTEGDVYISTHSGKIHKYSCKKDSSYLIYESPANHKISCLAWSNNRLVIGSFNGRVTFYDEDTRTTKDFDIGKENMVSHFFLNHNDQLFATCEKGMYKIDTIKQPEQNDINIIIEADSKNFIQTTNTLLINTFIEDSQGNYWYTTSNGIIEHEKKKDFIRHTFHHPNNINIRNSNVMDVEIDEQGYLWIAYFDAIVDVNNINNKQTVAHFYESKDNRNKFGSGTPLDIFVYDSNTVYVGSYNGGLSQYNVNTETFTKVKLDSLDTNHQHNHDVRKITKDKRGNLWLALHGGGVNMIEMQTNKVHRFRADYTNWKTNLHHDWLLSILCDSRNNIWVGSPEGLSKINTLTYKTESFKSDPQSAQTLSNNTINYIFEDSHKNIWIGTNGGLNRYIPHSNSFELIETKNGVISQQIMAITEHKDHLWISTKTGIIKLSIEAHTHTIYTKNDGLHSDEFSIGAVTKTKDGRIFMGGKNGISSFYADSIRPFSNTAPLTFTDFKIFNNSVTPEHQLPIEAAEELNNIDKLKLPYKESILTFQFALLNYNQPHRNIYSYYMKGLNNEWHSLENKNEVSFTALPPGTYELKIKATNSDKIWSDNVLSLTIQIMPAWWQTIYFKAGITLIVLFITYLFYYFRLKTIEKQKRILAIEVNRNTKELIIANKRLEKQKEEIAQKSIALAEKNSTLETLNETKDRLFSIISHDLKNPLSTLIGYSDLLLTNNKKITEAKKDQYVKSINIAAKSLFDLLSNLLDWTRSQTGAIIFRPVKLNLDSIVDEVVKLHSETALNKGIEIKKLSNSKIALDADPNMLSTVIRNLISNAIKFTRPQGTIKISSGFFNEHHVCISISDNGVGMNKKTVELLFSTTNQITTYGTNNETGTGLGLSICYEFVKMHNGEIKVDSIEGKGTVFRIILPIEQNGK